MSGPQPIELDSTPGSIPIPGFEIIDGAPWFAILEERFGIAPSFFEAYVIVKPNPKHIYLARRGLLIPERPRPDSIGMPFMRIAMLHPKLSTPAAMALGPMATRNAIDVERDQLDAFIQRRTLWPSQAQLEQCTGPGYVIVRHEQFALGIGLLRFPRPDAEDVRPFVESMFPKGWAMVGERSAFSSDGP
jgi:NOL1/NOP2/fmu family ribosome biogenesis protein